MTALLYLCLLMFQPVDFDSHLREGLLALQRGDFVQAADRLQQATQTNSESGIAWAALAQARLKMGDVEKADQAALTAERAASQPVVVRALLIYWSGRGEQSAVARLAEKALKSEDRPELHNVLGKAYLATKRRDEAVAELRKAASVEPMQEQYVFDLGQALLAHENFDEAAKTFEAGVNHLPASAQLQLALGVARYGQRRFAEAIDAFIKTVDLQPDIDQPYVFLGKIIDHAGDRLPQLQQRATAFLKLHADSSVANLFYARILLKAVDPDLSLVEQHLQRAVTSDGNSWEARLELGVLLARVRRFTEAERSLLAAIALKPNEPVCHYHLARVYDRLGKPEQASRERAIHKDLSGAPQGQRP